jgi:CRISPR system Cascade subunit CasE
MFLSRLSLADAAAERPDFWHAFGSEYTLHRAVWDLFGDRPDRRRDFLYRLDSRNGRPLLWTLSSREPDAPSGLWRIEARPVSPRLRPGDLLEFAVRVNPVVTRDGKRHDVVMDRKRSTGWKTAPPSERQPETALVQEALTEWLAARSDRLGARVRSLRADGYRVTRFPKPSGKEVQLGLCDLTGALEVVEPDRFVDAWRTGLGPAKGFGCGLMLIRRVRA